MNKLKENRKITVKLLETEQMNTYKILAEFLAIKFNERWFDKQEQKSQQENQNIISIGTIERQVCIT